MRTVGWIFWIAAMALMFSAWEGSANYLIDRYGVMYSYATLACLIVAVVLWILDADQRFRAE